MPNCNFYATPNDHAGLLTWLFAEGTCDVYQSYSDVEQPVKQFFSTDEVLNEFERRHPPNGAQTRCVLLQLYVRDAGPPVSFHRIALNPETCNGATFRYRVEGWGLVQLYLESVWHGQLQNSHTNHFSQKAAAAWGPVVREASSEPSIWDFKRITSFSSRFNREIRKRAIGKIGSCPVLPGALASWEAGVSLPHHAGSRSLQDIKNAF